MKKLNKTTLILALSTLVIGILIGWLTFGSTNTNAINEDDHSIVKDTETIWTCSMHPQIRKDEPGDCPICGMDLIPLESDQNEELDPMAVSMSATAMQLAQVQTLTVGKGSVTKSIQLNGKVQADERLLHTQSSHVSGRIEELAVTFTGDVVSKGQIIARLYSPELVTAQEELLEAQKIATTQPALFNAAKEKLKKWKLTDKQIDQVLTSGQAIESFPILADVSGYVTEKIVNLGDYVSQGEPIYQIADLSKVWVLFDVYETDMGLINKGDEVKYTIQSIPGKTFSGTISYIDPVIDPKTRVAKARVERSNADLLLKPEMFASG
ncbi:MAG: efflux RND transporter periplasmic adaptor subunit, partial [Erythrobacter sp.]|nr:efflux RND transporter periplasmic adaptor subunit [Erythrobacter sp.]